MPSFLAEQLERFGKDTESGQWDLTGESPSCTENIAEMAATAIHLLDRLESAAAREQPAHPAWDAEAARKFTPMFRQWFAHATVVLDRIRTCNTGGHAIEGAEEFIHRYNVAKLLASEFDRTAADYKLAGPPAGKSRNMPLDEVADELRRRGRTAGDR